jgi:hypothetical protein
MMIVVVVSTVAVVYYLENACKSMHTPVASIASVHAKSLEKGTLIVYMHSTDHRSVSFLLLSGEAL